MRRYDALVLDGHYRSALAATRALGRKGYHLAVDTRWPASRFAAARTAFPLASRTSFGLYQRELIAWLWANPTDVVLPPTDWAVDALDAVRDSLPSGTHAAVAESEALAVATSKRKTLERAAAVGVAIPRSITVRGPGEVPAAAQEVGFPCVLKPDRSWLVRDDFGVRVTSTLLTDNASAIAAGRAIVASDSPALVQEFVPGRRETMLLFRQQGQLRAALALRITRSWPPLGGNSVMRESIELEDDLARAAFAAAEVANLDGCSEIEFRRSEAGVPVLMEINPRFTQNLELALLCGLDFASMQVEWARGREVPIQTTYPAGVRLSWLGGEIRLLVGGMFGKVPERSFSDLGHAIARDFFRPPHVDGLALDDPLPTLNGIAMGLLRHPAERARRFVSSAPPQVQPKGSPVAGRDRFRLPRSATPATGADATLFLEPIDVLAEAHDDWQRLALASRNIFASWEWHDAWWRHFGRGRTLDSTICRTADGRAVMVLPVYRPLERPLKVARFLGHTTGDELGPIYASSDRGAVAAALTRYVVERQIQLVVAEHVPDAARWTSELDARVLATSPSPSLELAFDSWAAFLATRSANRRADVRRKERRLERDHAVSYRLTQRPDELERDLDTLFALHTARWGGDTSFLRAEAFHREFAAIAFERGWLRLWTLELDRHPRAAWYGFRYAGVESYYQSGRDGSAEFDRYGLGLILLVHSIKAALEDGMSEYRFLRGGERYKYHFTDSDRTVETVALPRSLMARGAVGTAMRARRLPLVRALATRL